MGQLIASRELPYFVGYLIAVVGITVIATLIIGIISKWRFPQATAAFGGIIIPAAILGLAGYVLFFTPDGSPPNDGKDMAAVGLFVLAAVTYPFTAIAGFLIARRGRVSTTTDGYQ